MRMEDEDDDPILLLDFNQCSYEDELNFEDIITIEDEGVKDIPFQINQKDFDTYIASCKKDISILPNSFCMIRKNVKLLNSCRPVSVKVVDCLRYLKRTKSYDSDCFYSNNLKYSVNINNIEITEPGNKLLTPCQNGNCISISLSFGKKNYNESNNTRVCPSLSRAIPHYHNTSANKFILGSKVCDQRSKFNPNISVIDKRHTSHIKGKIYKSKRPKQRIELNLNLTSPACISQNTGTAYNQIKNVYPNGTDDLSILRPVNLYADESSSRIIRETISSVSKNFGKDVQSKPTSLFKRTFTLNKNEIQNKYFSNSVTNAAPLLFSTDNHTSVSNCVHSCCISNTNHISNIKASEYSKIQKRQKTTDQHKVVSHNKSSKINANKFSFAKTITSSPELNHNLPELNFNYTSKYNKSSNEHITTRPISKFSCINYEEVSNFKTNTANNQNGKHASINTHKILTTISNSYCAGKKKIFQSSLSQNDSAPIINVDISKVSNSNYTLKSILRNPYLSQMPIDNANSTIVTCKSSLGYSPPILPIPTYQKTFELLSQVNLNSDRLSEGIEYMGCKKVGQEKILFNRRISTDIKELANRVATSYRGGFDGRND